MAAASADRPAARWRAAQLRYASFAAERSFAGSVVRARAMAETPAGQSIRLSATSEATTRSSFRLASSAATAGQACLSPRRPRE